MTRGVRSRSALRAGHQTDGYEDASIGVMCAGAYLALVWIVVVIGVCGMTIRTLSTYADFIKLDMISREGATAREVVTEGVRYGMV